jgi:hypothetical protein
MWRLGRVNQRPNGEWLSCLGWIFLSFRRRQFRFFVDGPVQADFNRLIDLNHPGVMNDNLHDPETKRVHMLLDNRQPMRLRFSRIRRRIHIRYPFNTTSIALIQYNVNRQSNVYIIILYLGSYELVCGEVLPFLSIYLGFSTSRPGLISGAGITTRSIPVGDHGLVTPVSVARPTLVI